MSIVALGLLGIAALVISSLPYGVAKPVADALAPDGQNDSFTASLFARIVVRLHIAGGLLLIVAGVLYAGRERFAGFAAAALSRVLTSTVQLAARASHAIRSETTTHSVAAVVIVLLAAALRVQYLSEPLRYDEAFAFQEFATPSLVVSLSHYAPNNHLLHTVLLRLAVSGLGNHPWVIRLPAFIAGLLLLPAVYLAARLIYDKDTALLAAGLAASSSILIEYSVNARGYTLVCLMSVLLLGVGAILIREGSNAAAWALFVVIAALGFYALPTMLYPYGIVAAWILLESMVGAGRAWRRELWKGLAAATAVTCVLVAILYSPVVLASGVGRITSNRFVAPRSWSYLLAEWPSLLLVLWKQWNRDVPAVIIVLLAAGFAAAIAVHSRISHYAVPLAAAVASGLVPILLLQRVVPDARVWLFLLPFYLILASAGVRYIVRVAVGDRLRSQIPAAIAIIALSLWLGWLSMRSSAIRDSGEAEGLGRGDEVARFLKSYLGPRDRVVVAMPASAPLWYYFDRSHMPAEYFWNADSKSVDGRLIIVLNETDSLTSDFSPRRQTIDDVLGRSGLSGFALGTPNLIRRFGRSSLYEIHPRGPSPATNAK